jgi:hypothetical protein
MPNSNPQTQPNLTLKPKLTAENSRFASPNPFQLLPDHPFPPDPENPSQFTSPFCLDVSPLPLSPPGPCSR